jgi:hypothetical protein
LTKKKKQSRGTSVPVAEKSFLGGDQNVLSQAHCPPDTVDKTENNIKQIT